MPTSRRAFLTSVGAFLAAPAIVRASSLMPVRSIPTGTFWVSPGVCISEWDINYYIVDPSELAKQIIGVQPIEPSPELKALFEERRRIIW